MPPYLPTRWVRVDVELVADVLEDLPVGRECIGAVESMRLGERLGVVRSNVDTEVS
jgi:hypothetical protein